MNYSTAQSLADSTLAAFKLDSAHGISKPDATTMLTKTKYKGPKGEGWEVRVTLKGKVNDLVVVRHFGPETARAKPDLTLATAKEQAIVALAKEPYRVLALARVKAATAIDGLLYDAASAQEEMLDALRLQCADYSQKRLDAFAASLGYDNITTIRAAALSSVARFYAEGVAGQAAWDAEWGAAQAFIAAVTAGTLQPTFDNYKAAMPASYTAPVYV